MTEAIAQPAPPVNIPAVFVAPKQATDHPFSYLPAVPPSVAKVATAIAAIMTEIGVVAKDGQNKFHNYAYAKMEDILKRLTPLMAKNGLVVFQTEVSRSMFDDDKVIAVQYAFTICHSSGEIWPDRPLQTGMSRCRDSKQGFDDKALNKAHTAARKYFLLSLFQIPTGDDDDADSHDAAQRAPKRPNIPSPDAPQSEVASEIEEDIRLQYLSYVDLTIKEWAGPWEALKDWWMSDAQKQNRVEYGFTQDEVNTFKSMIAARRPQDAQTSSGAPKVPPAPESSPATAVSDADSILAEIERNYDKGIADLEAMLRKCRSKDEVNALWADTVAMAPEGLILAPDMKALLTTREQVLTRK